MEEADIKLFEKFEKAMSMKPGNDAAAKFLSGLSQEEYDRLIQLFENNRIEGMDENIRLKLVETYKKIKEGLAKNK